MSLLSRSALVVLVGVALGLGLALGGALLDDRGRSLPSDLSWEQARLFAEVMERVKRDYIEPIDDRALVESAIRGMVADLDRHSQYLDATEFEEIRISTTGSYSGIGVEVSTVDGEIIVVTPIDGTPAQAAGIRAGDVIVAIDDLRVEQANLHQTIGKMRGRIGTHVIVTVEREGEDKPLVFNIVRGRISVASVRYELLQPGFGYARVSQFTESTARELSAAVDALMDEAAADSGHMLSGLVLDLRNNPGGILDAAVEVSDLFLDDGIIVTADGRTPESRFTHDASRGDLLDGAPMVVLVNGGSASASEIVAGALQDHDRAMILGESTFGKGLVQTVMPLSRGRAIKLTTSRYYTPSGDSINEVGIDPDIQVEGSAEFPGSALSRSADREHDEQLIQALRLLDGRPVMHSDAGEPSSTFD